MSSKKISEVAKDDISSLTERDFDLTNSDGNNEVEKDEIDLIGLFLLILEDRKYIFYTLAVFISIGLIVAFTGKEEYKSQVKLLSEGGQQGININLAQQFGLGGFSSNPQQDAIATRFYPDIVESLPFMISLMDHEIYSSRLNENLTIYEYFNDHYPDDRFSSKFKSSIRKYTVRLPFTIAGWLRKSSSEGDDYEQVKNEQFENTEVRNILSLTSRELKVISSLRQRIDVKLDNGIIIIYVKMPEASLAGDVADNVMISLVNFVKSYRTEKSRRDVEFIENRFGEARKRFELAQHNLAQFRDSNRGQLTQMARMQEQSLQSEYDFSFNIYNTLARRLEEAQLNLQEETPVVQILEPAVIPNSISEPRREFILTVSIFLGIIMGLIVIFIRRALLKLNNIVKFRKGR